MRYFIIQTCIRGYKISNVLVIVFEDKADLYSSSVFIVASITISICIKIRTIIIYNTYVEFLYMSMDYEVRNLHSLVLYPQFQVCRHIKLPNDEAEIRKNSVGFSFGEILPTNSKNPNCDSKISIKRSSCNVQIIEIPYRGR